MDYYTSSEAICPDNYLLIMYKTFVRPHLDYGDIIYEQTYNTYFH